MGRIAVDVVLLPSEEVVAAAIKANRELLRQHPGEIELDAETCLPHISLAMGCVERSDITQIGQILQKLAGSNPPGDLISLGISVGTNSVGERVSVLGLERTERLQKLHENVMHEMEPFFTHDVTPKMVFSPPPAGESTLRWIREYPEKSSFKRFFPHITLGYGLLDDPDLPARFTARRLALCHLGNHCTCRKILT